MEEKGNIAGVSTVGSLTGYADETTGPAGERDRIRNQRI